MAFAPEIKREAQDLAKDGLTPQQIVDRLNKKYQGMLVFKHPTVSNWLKKEDEHPEPSVFVPSQPPLNVAAQPPRGVDIMVIGDMQVKPELDLGYCYRVGRYAADEKPAIILCIGDFADMPSHSFHDEPGSKSFSMHNYKDDILATHLGMKMLMAPIKEEMERTGWNPRLVMCLGNHEHRILRTLEKIPKLDGTLGIQDLEYERWGWEVIPFLKQITIAGITFSHYFPSGQMGRPISSARAMLTKGHVSCVAGHQQGRDIAFGKRMDGKQITAIICGSTYEHDEGYLNPQTNNHWRGFYMLNDCVDGEFEEKAVSMKYLRRRYGDSAPATL